MNDGSYYTESIGRNEGNLNIYFNLVDGTYERVHSNGNFETTDNYAITLSIDDYQLSAIKVFPNPVSNFLQIKNTQDVTVKVFSINGRLLQIEKFNNEINMNVADLKTGIYFIEISNLTSRKRLKIIKD